MEKKWDFWTYTVILALQIHQGAIVRAKVYLTVTSKKKKKKKEKKRKKKKIQRNIAKHYKMYV